MHSMRDLLDRARAWPRRALGDQPEITDRVSLHFSHISPRLKSEDILTPEEVAARLKVPESWVYEKTRVRCRNPIPCLRLGRYVRFDWLAVIAWLTEASALEQNAPSKSLPAKRKPAR
jgi:excisionase family DNA binding protein